MMMRPARSLSQRLPFFYGWVILCSAASTQVARNSAASLTIAVFMFPLAEELGWSRTLIAGAASFGGLAASGVSPAVGWLVDRYGARLVLASSVFILGLSTISLAWATIPVAFYLAYGIGRVIFASPIPIAASVVVSRWFVRKRGRANGMLFASHSIGLVSFPIIASAIIAGPGWREAWIVLGLLVWITALIPVTLLIIQRPEDIGLLPDGDAELSDNTGTVSETVEEPAWTLKAAMRTPALWILAAGVGTLFLVQAGINTHMAALLRDQGLSAWWAGVGLGLSAAFMGAGSLLWGWLAEKFPPRHVLAVVALAVAGPALLYLTADTTLEGVAYSSVFGFGVGGMLSVPPVAYADYYGPPVPGSHPWRHRAFHQLGAGHRRSRCGYRIRPDRQLRHRPRLLCRPWCPDRHRHPLRQAPRTGSGPAAGTGRSRCRLKSICALVKLPAQDHRNRDWSKRFLVSPPAIPIDSADRA